MPLNKSKGNMYDFITHTWNTVKGECYHDCSYCYMKRWGKLNPVRFDQKELKTDLGSGNFIFVGSSCDMFTNIEYDWILSTLYKCRQHDNKYFFQSKNTFGFDSFINQKLFPKDTSFCTTIETNRFYKEFMGNTPQPHERAFHLPINNYITIEPIMNFDLGEFLTILNICHPKQINIGADSGNNKLPEPSKDKILELISELKKFTKVKLKKNLNKLILNN